MYHTPVDASCVHQVSDVSAGPLDGLKGLLHLLLFGDVTADRHVVSWEEKTQEGRQR